MFLTISYTLLSISTNLIHYQFPVSMQNHTWVLALALFPFLAKTFFEIISNEWTRAFLTKSMLDNDAQFTGKRLLCNSVYEKMYI